MATLTRSGALLLAGAAALTATAYAQGARLAISETEGGAALTVRWSDGREGPPPVVSAESSGGVVVVRFAEPVEADASGLAASAPNTVAFARLSPAEQSLRLALRRPMEAEVSEADGARIVRLSPPAAAQPAAPPAAPAVEVGVAEREGLSRLSFSWEGGAPSLQIVQRSPERYELRFSRPGDVDLSRLRTAPPRYVRSAQTLSGPGANLRILVTVDPGVRRRTFSDEGRVVVDFLPPEEPPAVPARQAEAPPAPASGSSPGAETRRSAPVRIASLRLQVEELEGRTVITAPFEQPVQAAAFRRDGALWLLFDGVDRIDLTGVARAGRRHSDITPVQAEGAAGVRIAASGAYAVTAETLGGAWRFALAERGGAGQAFAPVRRDDATGGLVRLLADFNRSGRVVWVDDPAIGDRIGVALTHGPILGIAERRSTVEAALLPSLHGAAIEPRADGVSASFENGVLAVTRGQGLMASGRTALAGPTDPLFDEIDPEELIAADPQEGDERGGMWARAPARDVLRRLQALQRRVAGEGLEPGARNDARLALARFLIANELAAEGLGALRLAAQNQPQLDADPDFRLLRGAANTMMGRMREAQQDLAAPALANDPSAALWRGYALALGENWVEARRDLERGMRVLETQPPDWRARFLLAQAQAALALDDFTPAGEAARMATVQAVSPDVRNRAQLVAARVALAGGDRAAGLSVLDGLSRVVGDEEVAVRAVLEATEARLQAGEIEAAAAAEALEALRFRWRGDSLELETIAALGRVYARMGRWREALDVMQSAVDRYPAIPAARRLRQEMADIYEQLFLDGGADAMDPIQALALFYEFDELTPLGSSGDRMVRQLAGRLVRLDLLSQAAGLLQHQVDERLQGNAKAEIAADLAAIYLMDRRPEQALAAINATRLSSLPASVTAERRILEARAMLDLRRFDHAAEIVERDESAEGQRVRAEAAWRQRDWERASVELRRLLAARRQGEPLSDADRQIVLRAAIAGAMSEDEAGLRGLYRDFAAGMAGTPQANAFELVAGGVHAEGMTISQLARAVSRTDLLQGFLDEIRARIAAAGGSAPSAPPPPSAREQAAARPRPGPAGGDQQG